MERQTNASLGNATKKEMTVIRKLSEHIRFPA